MSCRRYVLLVAQLPLQVGGRGVHAPLLIAEVLVQLHGQRGDLLALGLRARLAQREARLHVASIFIDWEHPLHVYMGSPSPVGFTREPVALSTFSTAP